MNIASLARFSQTNSAWLVIGITVAAVIGVFIYRQCKWHKHDRHRDLYRYWAELANPDGTDRAYEFFTDAIHVCLHYSIQFQEIDPKCPNEPALRRAACEAINRRIVWANKQLEEQKKAFTDANTLAHLEHKNSDYVASLEQKRDLIRDYDIEAIV